MEVLFDDMLDFKKPDQVMNKIELFLDKFST